MRKRKKKPHPYIYTYTYLGKREPRPQMARHIEACHAPFQLRPVIRLELGRFQLANSQCQFSN